MDQGSAKCADIYFLHMPHLWVSHPSLAAKFRCLSYNDKPSNPNGRRFIVTSRKKTTNFGESPYEPKDWF